MPHAYSPNLRTVHRAAAACNALGITGWHMAGGPDVWYWEDAAGSQRRLVRVPLRHLEARAASVAPLPMHAPVVIRGRS